MNEEATSASSGAPRPAGDDSGESPLFEFLGERTIYEGRVIRLVEAHFRGPRGEDFTRDVVRSPGAVAIVALAETSRGPEAVVVRQFRPPIGTWLTEIPAGVRDKPGEPAEMTAGRELAEEAGLAAERFELLTVFENAAGMTDQRTHIYLATGLSDVPVAREGVEEEYLQVGRVLLANVPTMVAAGELTDAKTVIGLLLAWQRCNL